MAELARDSAATSVVALLAHYSFDGGGLTVEQLVDQWLRRHSVQWVRLALIEALYQGRYKAISVTQILAFWQRRERPLYRFDPEFEHLICNRLPTRPSAEGQRRANTSISQTNAPTPAYAQAPQVGSSAKQLRSKVSTLPLHHATSEKPSGVTNPAVNENEQIQSSEEPLLSTVPIERSDKVVSPSAHGEADQSNSAPTNAGQPTWSKYSIHRFTPNIEASSFQTKLSALAQCLHQETSA